MNEFVVVGYVDNEPVSVVVKDGGDPYVEAKTFKNGFVLKDNQVIALIGPDGVLMEY